jgi:HK97 family phage major capsid protein
VATQVEILRKTASDAAGAFTAELAKYSADNIPTPEQEQHVTELRTAMTDAAKELNRAESFAQNQATWDAQNEQLSRAKNVPPHSMAEVLGSEKRGAPRSVGQQFVQLPAYKEWLARVAPTGSIPEGVRGLQSPPLAFGGLRELDTHATLLTGASDTSAGAFVTPTYYPGLTELGRRPLTIRQIITNLQTESDTVEYVRIVSETNNAAPVAEATATSGSSGVKPESGMTYERVSTPVKTIAHWIPATRRSISDATQLRGLIDAFLRYGLDEELEDQIANGNGSGENFTGILNTSGTQAQAWDTDLLRTLRVAKRKVRTVGRRIPNAYVLNPEDWETIELSQDNQYRYYGAGPFGDTAPRLWGLPVIESEAVPVGTGLVGDFTTCVLWDREQASISISDSHSDFFIRNLVAILAELRAAFGILKPNAIVEVDLTA